MLARPALAALAALLLASCERQVKCDYQGLIVIPPDASEADQRRWVKENLDLLAARMDAAINSANAQYHDKALLQKAASCP